jgi:hypothetical protein
VLKDIPLGRKDKCGGERMIEYLIVLGLVLWAMGELLAGILLVILLVTVLIAALAAAIKRK